ncbi:hypothetical protein PQJ75_22550 [Rhodoplanes sp. TEM]|uniref:Uncharacterized protein n=1 Tax=Rhodoplanes tepidamans TaxID=200616 RepID=A0ABT5JER4_RHOTP|nr:MULTISPECIES: hypothetical protein [Rhodoplanes]MDC7788173.1 hypothetical protein [Rhodoplanes tepidamans]MDC7986518.1 hypothetical protein [Rhodoplanes sp. TEM]MDQ0355137.1 uncharacterized protein with PIN domain [Rhodoplanes tepidamans]
MMNSGGLEVRGPERPLFGKQHCPRCSYLLVAPDESHHIADRVVRHMWTCEACGTGFSTWVKFQPELGELHCVPQCAEAA